MTKLRWGLTLTSLVAVALYACGSSSDDAPKGGGGSGAPVTSYTPKSCDYAVSLPDSVEDATMDGREVGAEPTPKNVHVSWAGPPSSSFAVNWGTGLDTRLTQVLYGTDPSAVAAADRAGAGVSVQLGHTFIFGSSSPLYADQKARVHEGHVCGLEPGTTYYYKVGGPGHWSAVYDVATAPAPETTTPFRFVLSGDSRGDPGAFAEIQRAARDAAADFQIFTGDAVMVGANQLNWDEFFQAKAGSFAAEEALARIPFMTVVGNHEALALNYFVQFAFPGEETEGESPDSRGEEWYSFQYGNAYFFMLNDTVTDQNSFAREAAWMKTKLDGLDRAKIDWVFAVHHRPLYTCSNHSPLATQVDLWGKVYDEHEVDMVLAGHNHCYERSKPIRAGAEAPMGGGTIYVTAGGAGAPLYSTGTDCPLEQITEKTRGYVIIDIDGKKLDYRALRNDASEIEAFSLTK